MFFLYSHKIFDTETTEEQDALTNDAPLPLACSLCGTPERSIYFNNREKQRIRATVKAFLTIPNP